MQKRTGLLRFPSVLGMLQSSFLPGFLTWMPLFRWVQTEMGNSAAAVSGLSQAPMSTKDSVASILLVVSKSFSHFAGLCS